MKLSDILEGFDTSTLKLKDLKVRKGAGTGVRKGMTHANKRKPIRAKQKRDWKKTAKDE